MKTMRALHSLKKRERKRNRDMLCMFIIEIEETHTHIRRDKSKMIISKASTMVDICQNKREKKHSTKKAPRSRNENEDKRYCTSSIPAPKTWRKHKREKIMFSINHNVIPGILSLSIFVFFFFFFGCSRFFLLFLFQRFSEYILCGYATAFDKTAQNTEYIEFSSSSIPPAEFYF